MNYVDTFRNVASGGYLRYGLMRREEKINDLLSLNPRIKGMTAEEALNKAMNLAIASPGRESLFPAESLARFAVREISDSVERGEPHSERSGLYEQIFNFARWVTEDQAQQAKFYRSLMTYAHGQLYMAQSDIDLIEKTVREESPAVWNAHLVEQDRIRTAYGR